MKISTDEWPDLIDYKERELKLAAKNRESNPNQQIISLMILVERLKNRVDKLEKGEK